MWVNCYKSCSRQQCGAQSSLSTPASTSSTSTSPSPSSSSLTSTSFHHHCFSPPLFSPSSHLHLKQANGRGARLHGTKRFQWLCGFFVCKILFLCLCAFYTTIFHVHGKVSLAYCAHFEFLLFLGAKIMANTKTKKVKWPTT